MTHTEAAHATGSRIAARVRRHSAQLLPGVALLLDLAVIAVAIVLGAVGRKYLGIFDQGAEVASSLSVAGPLIVLAWVAVIWIRGAYAQDVFGAGPDEYKRVVAASLITAALVGVGCYLAKFPLSRGFFALAFAAGIPLLVLGRWLLRRGIHRARRNGYLHERVLIAGTPTHVDEIAGVFSRDSWLGYEVAGAVLPSGFEREETGAGVPVLGSTDAIATLVRETEVDVLFLAGGAISSARAMRQLAWDLESHPVQLIVAPSITDIAGERVKIRPVGGLPLVHIERPRSLQATRWAKRTFDVVASTLLLVVFSPLLLAAAVRIRLHDGEPVIFRQPRVGKGGDEFQMLKFRTMVVDAEERLEDLRSEVDDHGVLFKLPDDPRVTKPGRWLRRSSVDELPQLLNVLRGQMSLVGPRPPLLSEVAKYDDRMRRRLRVRPGMTGLWQVSGRSDLSWDEAVRLDLFYVDNWSMIQDLVILFRTLRAVVRSHGAY